MTWSSNGRTLASGSDDNTVKLWSVSDPGAITSFSHKESAVKAMAWSPHQPEILATGGGRADPYIRFWDTNTHTETKALYADCQITNLAYSKSVNQVVTTHGYTANDIKVWDCNSKAKDNLIGGLYGHSHRIVYMAMSPDGTKIVTGSGDEEML